MYGIWSESSVGTAVSTLADAAGEGVAFIFIAEASVTVDVATFSVASVSGTPTLRATIEGVDASGNPDGTIVAGSSAVDIAGAAGLMEFTGLNAALTAGTAYALRLQYLSGATSATINYSRNNTGSASLPHVSTYAAGAWTKRDTATLGLLGGLGLSTSSYLPWRGLVGGVTSTDTVYTDASAVDEYGLRFTWPTPLRIVGLMAAMGGPASGTLHVVMTDSSGNDVGSTLKTYDTDLWAATSTEGIANLMLAAPFVTTANTVYNLSIKSTSAGNISLRRLNYTTNAQLGQLFSKDWFEVQRANATTGSGAWTENNTFCPLIFPLVDQGHDGSGGSAGGARIMGAGRVSGG